jgi:23S rRNA (cytidine1920-2'-O)/16S rRNA (cytidine1409-2'-O)-methyltransferase
VSKVRLDQLLVERGLVESRERAQALIRAGRVMVNDRVSDKPGRQVAADAALRLAARLPYVSRGGLKLEAALRRFDLNVRGWVAADVGASTGGFTDCLLQHGAARVYAVDVGYGQLAWGLRGDARVVVMERTNVRHMGSLPEQVDLATVDVSFIGLELVLPVVRGLLKATGRIVALVKPQFEAGRRQVGKGGVVREPAVHREVLTRLTGWAEQHALRVLGLVPSPLKGPKGNAEFFLHLALASGDLSGRGMQRLIDAALLEVHGQAAGQVEQSNG